MYKTLLKIIMASQLLMCSFSIAEDKQQAVTSYINFSAGAIGVFDDIEAKKLYGIEYRIKPVTRWKVIPALGYLQSENGAFYAYNDLKYDLLFKDKWYFTPGIGIGFFKNSDEVDLGHHLEFRTSFELSLELKNKVRIGFIASHVSNSKLSDTNPGTESIAMSVSWPLD